MPSAVATSRSGGSYDFRRATFAGFSSSLVGIGLARFAYTPLIPAMIDAKWFTPPEMAYLGAANFAGYLFGALIAHRLASQAPPAAVLRAMMILVAGTFIAGAYPMSFSWFFVWRFASGYAGGVLTVLGASTILAMVSPRRRGVAGGIIFAGVGTGVAGTGLLAPLFLSVGLVETWFALGALSLTLALASWGCWPTESSHTPPPVVPITPAGHSWPLPLRAFYVTYGLVAVAVVPHMVYWVDFIARELERGIDAGATAWTMFGLGAAVGPVLLGLAADRVGTAQALRATFVAVAASIALPLFANDEVALAASSLVLGAFVPGVAGLAVNRVHELIPDAGPERTAAWGMCTTSFAIGQAAAAYGYSFLFARIGVYAPLFALGAGALLAALALDLIVAVFAWRAARESKR